MVTSPERNIQKYNDAQKTKINIVNKNISLSNDFSRQSRALGTGIEENKDAFSFNRD